MLNRTNRLLLAIAGLLVVIAVSAALVPVKTEKEETLKETPVAEEVPVPEERSLFAKEDYDGYYAVNSDYIGQIIFASGIIDEPVVYSEINSYYLRRNLSGEYSIQGTVYMDERNTLDDENIILYGHYTEPEYTDYAEYAEGVRPMFSNLELLLDKENYEANREVYLYLKNEVRTYEVVSVYYCPLLKDENGEYAYVEEGYSYYYTSYSEEESEAYKKLLEDKSLYDTGIEINSDDRLLTLQTCVRAREDLREIVVLKEISSASY